VVTSRNDVLNQHDEVPITIDVVWLIATRQSRSSLPIRTVVEKRHVAMSESRDVGWDAVHMTATRHEGDPTVGHALLCDLRPRRGARVAWPPSPERAVMKRHPRDYFS
jgi:hypothetical protein